MRSSSNEKIVQDNMIVILAYELFTYERGELLLHKKGIQKFIQGSGEIPPGLECKLYGLKIGDQKEVYVKALDGFGEIDPDEYLELPLDEVPSNILLEPGAAFHLEFGDGDWVDGFVESVNHNLVRLSLNHSLAGKDLCIRVSIEDIRSPKPEEITQGAC